MTGKKIRIVLSFLSARLFGSSPTLSSPVSVQSHQQIPAGAGGNNNWEKKGYKTQTTIQWWNNLF